MTEPNDTREEVAAALERLAAQVREHGVLPDWNIGCRAESVEVPSGIYLNRHPSGVFHHTVEVSIDRSASWSYEELNHV